MFNELDLINYLYMNFSIALTHSLLTMTFFNYLLKVIQLSEIISIDIVLSSLLGFNGTIFLYG